MLYQLSYTHHAERRPAHGSRKPDFAGAAYAGRAVGFWSSIDELRHNWSEGSRWEPQWSEDRREQAYADWKRAVQRTLDWVDVS